MKAVGYQQSKTLLDFEIPTPKPTEQDVLVEVKAISVNPVDSKVRQRFSPENGNHKILGWDAAGIVREVGEAVTQFKPGDEIWYAGSIARPGTNSEFHLVDERIAAKKPKSLSFAEAAAMPLTTITAWELLFDRLGIQTGKQAHSAQLLIIGAAGGVGSILTQLAHQVTDLTVIGTASRNQTHDWVLSMGADHVVDHSKSLSEELQRIGLNEVSHIASLTNTDEHYQEIVKCLSPQGKLGLIDDPQHIDITLLKQKSISLHWEFMYTRSLFATADIIKQHQLLAKVAELVDSGALKTTVGDHYGKINAKNLQRAHTFIESGKAIGKIVLEGF